ncbi:hypothetical protein B5E58_10910 [Tyzzerella sp. An114]|nr:hypothetical protein B5E58_10910 [Tyzzerella sp. An114]
MIMAEEINIKELKEQHREYAELIGVNNLMLLSKRYGGTNIYIPKVDELLKNQRYVKIINEFNGDNIKYLARKYKVSERTVYRLVKELINEMKSKPFEEQISIFDRNL